MLRTQIRVICVGSIAVIALAACGGASPTPTPSPTPAATGTPAVTATPTLAATASPSPAASSTALPPPTPGVTAAPTVTATPIVTPGPIITGPATLDAPDSIAADTVFEVNWTGPNNQGDYVTIVPAGATAWAGEQFFYTNLGTPRQFTSPTTPGAYELWYVDGASSDIKTRRPITITAFVGSLDGPDSVLGGTEFSVTWTGPASPGDYITIEAVGATGWAGESFFYAGPAAEAVLAAPLTAGPHELWYVAGDSTVMLREPIAVLPVQASVSGPASVTHGAVFQVTWTGPDAANDYITIVEAGAPEGSYLSYAYTSAGSPASLTAPDTAGQYELRYVYGVNGQTIATSTIQVK